jgi:branched-chain amino acid aminotransferase
MVPAIIVITPTINNCLNGITRKSIMQIAKDFGYKTTEKVITKEEFLGADEIFLTGTAAELTPIKKVENSEFGVGEITKKLQNKYDEVIHGKDEKYLDWLTFVE